MNAGLFAGLLSPDLHLCCLCGRERYLSREGLCEECLPLLRYANEPAPAAGLDGMTAGLVYDEPIAHAFYRFKAEGETYLASFFAQFMHVDDTWQADVIMPVPLHPLKLWARTYNQSELLARALSEASGIPVNTAWLKRIRYTGAQKSRTAASRRTALKNAFLAAPEVKGRRVILVDDVVTTGSTLTACAAALRKAGAVQVFAACAAAVGR